MEPSTSMHQTVVEAPNPAGAWSSIVTLLNCAVGAGVLSLPFAFRCTGWLAGLIVTMLIAAIEAFTLYVLSRYAEHTRSTNYSELVRKMLGTGAALIMSVVLFLYIWGSAVAYLIILGDCFQPLLQQAFGEAWFTERDTVILLFSCAFILPLCFPRTLTAIAGVSSLTLYGLIVVVGAVMVRSIELMRGDPDHWRDVKAFSPTLRFLSALPIFVFGFQCHTNVIAVFDELHDSPVLFPSFSTQALNGSNVASSRQTIGPEGYTELPLAGHSRSRRRLKSPKLMGMVWVVMLAIGITCFFYCCVGVFGYLAFPTSVHSNILTNFRSDDRMMQVARGVVGVIEIASYPVMHNPARATVRDMLYQLTGLRCGGSNFNALETLLFFASTLMVALLVSDLGVVFQLVGGTGGGLLIFTLPGLLLMQYAYSKHVQSKQRLLEPLLLPPSEGPASVGDGGEVEDGGEDSSLAQDEDEEQQPPQGRQGGFVWPDGALHSRRHLPLQPLRSGLSSSGAGVYQFWTSKLWWAGVALVLLSVALCVVTVYTVFVPTSEA